MLAEARMGVGVIGAGRVGPIVAAALAGAGHALTGISRGSDTDRIQAILPGVPELEPEEITRRSELVILALPHEVLPEMVRGLAELQAWQPGQLVLHTDPAYGVEVLQPAQAAGALVLAVHPAISFTGTSIDLRQLQGAYAGVAAATPILPIAQALAVEMGCEPVVIAAEHRTAYAEAVDTAASFSHAIITQATGLLSSAGVENPGGFLSALVLSTVEQALRNSAGDAPGRLGESF